MDSNPSKRGPHQARLEGESEGVRLPNVAERQSLQQAQSERRILVWQQNKASLQGGLISFVTLKKKTILEIITNFNLKNVHICFFFRTFAPYFA